MIGSNRMKGFTLLIAVVLSSIAAAVTLALTTLAYKGLILSSAAKESQFAFYGADSALECVFYWDSGTAPSGTQNNQFPFTPTPGSPTVTCAGISVNAVGTYASGETRYISSWFATPSGRCARFSVYKTSTTVRAYAEGTNVACTDLSNPRGIVRAIRAIY